MKSRGSLFLWCSAVSALAVPASALAQAVPLSAPSSAAPAPSKPKPKAAVPVLVPGRGTAVPVNPQGLGTAVPVSPQGLGTAVPVTTSQPPLARPPEGSGTAVPVGSGPVVVVPVGPGGGGDIVVQTPSNGEGSPMLVTPAGPLPPEQDGVRRHYQLIALGFEVLRQTVDDMLERDGAGDEVQIRSTALNVAADGSFLGDTSTRSGKFGAPDHSDFGAGTAEAGWSADQRLDGLKTGDIYPRTDFGVASTVVPKHDGDLPMVLWDGVLENGGNSVVVVPTIWELDSNSPQSAIRSWGMQLDYQAREHPQRIAAALTHVVSEQPAVDDDLFPEISIAIQGDRPIATAEQLPTVRIVDILLPIILVQRPAALDPKIIMKIPAIPLSFQRAEELSGRGPSMIRIRKPDGSTVTRYLPTGGFAVRYKDPDGMDGDYLLSLRLIRIDDQGRQE